jgi:hypothetical protein
MYTVNKQASRTFYFVFLFIIVYYQVVFTMKWLYIYMYKQVCKSTKELKGIIVGLY